MGTRNINNLILAVLYRKSQTVAEIALSIEKKMGEEISEQEIIKSLERLNRRGYLKVSKYGPQGIRYGLTILGQSVQEKPKK